MVELQYISKYDSTKPKCYTPYPIVKNGTSGGSYVTFLENIGFGTIKGFGLDLKDITGDPNQQRWNDGVNNIESWQELLTAIDAHFKVLYDKINTTPTPTPTPIPTLSIQSGSSTNQYTTSQGVNASWSVTGGLSCTNSGVTTTISGPKGSFTLKSNNSTSVTINSGASLTINIKYVSQTTNGTLTAAASGYNNGTLPVSYTSVAPSSIALTGLSTQTVNLTNGEATVTITPSSSGSVGVSGYSGSLSVAINTPQPQTSPYYFYVGLNRPDNSTTISNVVTGGNPGWHLIGDSLANINVNNRAHDSSNPSNMICVEPTYETDDGVDYYIVIPTELNIYDGLGNNIIGSARYTNLGNVEIQGHTYKVIKDHDFDFIFNIY